jgi:hypothetical protein
MRAILVAIFIMGTLVAGYSQTNDWSKRIVSKTEHPLASLIFAHVGPVNVLTIDGKRFEHVRGINTFYLPVPQTNAIVFVVAEKDFSITYHVFNMDNDEDIAIHALSTFFGEDIGFSRPRDTVEIDKTGAGRLVLCNLDQDAKSTLQSLTNLFSMKSLYYLDLNKKAVIAEKTFYYDKAGSVLLEHDATPPF